MIMAELRGLICSNTLWEDIYDKMQQNAGRQTNNANDLGGLSCMEGKIWGQLVIPYTGCYSTVLGDIPHCRISIFVLHIFRQRVGGQVGWVCNGYPDMHTGHNCNVWRMVMHTIA
ncbi:hypothetical protein ABW19_dt0203451 [Dactylella cylindrospora]|nr:hypothetical protein ABW19_dt0203451 [Dactylella cylindrospora]